MSVQKTDTLILLKKKGDVCFPAITDVLLQTCCIILLCTQTTKC